MLLADLGAERDPGRRHRRRRRSTPASRGAAPGTATSRSSPPTIATTCPRRCSATPTSRSSTGRKRWSRPGASAARDLQAANPALVYARCRPSRTATGAVDDYGLLVEARAGFCTQLAGHRPGPIFVDVARGRQRAPRSCSRPRCSRCCCRRAQTGAGGWAETSLYDGMLATLGCMIGRSERAPAEVEGVLGDGLDLPQLPVPLRRRRAASRSGSAARACTPSSSRCWATSPAPRATTPTRSTARSRERAVRWRSFFDRATA